MFLDKAGMPALCLPQGRLAWQFNTMKRKGNNMKFKKVLALLLSACMVIGLLGACSNNEGTDSQQPSQDVTESQDVPEDPDGEQSPPASPPASSLGMARRKSGPSCPPPALRAWC